MSLCTRVLSAAVVIILTASSFAAHAAILYTFQLGQIGPYPNITGTYEFVEPALLTSDTVISAANLFGFSGSPITDIVV